MLRNQELLDFEIDLASRELLILDAPGEDDALLSSLGLGGPDRRAVVEQVVRSRRIAVNRDDIQQILAAFGVESSIELAFRGHGLSLTDQLWYRAPGSNERWEDINFFDNDWDAGFGASVLAHDYQGIASCSLDTPDVTTSGHLRKAWERSNEGVYLVKEPLFENGCDIEGALLGSQLCRLLYGEEAYQPLLAVERNGRRFSASPLMISRDEELVQGARLFALGSFDGCKIQELMGPTTPQYYIDIISRAGVPDASAQVSKIFAFKSLSLLADLHAGNFGIIRNLETGAIRAALPFDYDRAFGFPYPDFPFEGFCNNPSFVALACARVFSDLDPSWDWSWYDPSVLDGFENCILEAYKDLRSPHPSLGNLVAGLFVLQRDYVNKVSAGGEQAS